MVKYILLLSMMLAFSFLSTVGTLIMFYLIYEGEQEDKAAEKRSKGEGKTWE